MDAIMKRSWLFVLAAAFLLFSPTSARRQASALSLNQLDEAHLDSLAALTAQKIRSAKLTEKEPRVLVMDFFRNSPGTSSQLGTLLAARFAESLSAHSSGLQILNRTLLHDFLLENWTTLEDLKSNEICWRIARQLGATGAILGTLTEKNDTIELTLHVEGFGPTEKEDDIFAWRDRTVSFSATEDLHASLFQPGPNYTRKGDEIPKEPGVFRAGIDGVAPPTCAYCPDPEYADAARVARFQGTVILSVVVTPQGEVTGIYVLKGAPFGLTAQAISAIKNWRFRPAQQDGKPVPVRAQVEIGFRLLSGPDSQ